MFQPKHRRRRLVPFSAPSPRELERNTQFLSEKARVLLLFFSESSMYFTFLKLFRLCVFRGQFVRTSSIEICSRLLRLFTHDLRCLFLWISLSAKQNISANFRSSRKGELSFTALDELALVDFQPSWLSNRTNFSKPALLLISFNWNFSHVSLERKNFLRRVFSKDWECTEKKQNRKQFLLQPRTQLHKSVAFSRDCVVVWVWFLCFAGFGWHILVLSSKFACSCPFNKKSNCVLLIAFKVNFSQSIRSFWSQFTSQPTQLQSFFCHNFGGGK